MPRKIGFASPLEQSVVVFAVLYALSCFMSILLLMKVLAVSQGMCTFQNELGIVLKAQISPLLLASSPYNSSHKYARKAGNSEIQLSNLILSAHVQSLSSVQAISTCKESILGFFVFRIDFFIF